MLDIVSNFINIFDISYQLIVPPISGIEKIWPFRYFDIAIWIR